MCQFDNSRVVSSLIFIFFEKIRLPDIPNDIPRHIPIPIPALLFNEFIKTTLSFFPNVFLNYIRKTKSSQSDQNRFIYKR